MIQIPVVKGEEGLQLTVVRHLDYFFDLLAEGEGFEPSTPI